MFPKCFLNGDTILHIFFHPFICFNETGENFKDRIKQISWYDDDAFSRVAEDYVSLNTSINKYSVPDTSNAELTGLIVMPPTEMGMLIA